MALTRELLRPGIFRREGTRQWGNRRTSGLAAQRCRQCGTGAFGVRRPSLMAKKVPAEPTAKRSFFLSFAAGGSAGVVTKTCVQPLERVKNILQIQGAPGKSGVAGQSGSYNGIFGTLRKVIAEEGGLALWKGNAANCVDCSVHVVGLTNDSIQQAIAGEGRTARDWCTTELVLAGTMAGVVQQVICYPFETVKAHGACLPDRAKLYERLTVCSATAAMRVGLPFTRSLRVHPVRRPIRRCANDVLRAAQHRS